MYSPQELFRINYVEKKDNNPSRQDGDIISRYTTEDKRLTIETTVTRSDGSFNRTLLVEGSDASKDEIEAALKMVKLPTDTTKMRVALKQLEKFPYLIAQFPQITSLTLQAVKECNLNEVVNTLNIPAHITSMEINDLWGLVKARTGDELARFFRAFPKKLEKLTLTNIPKGENEQLKKLLIHLPVSVNTVSVLTKSKMITLEPARTINLQELFFPKSYSHIIKQFPGNPLQQGLAIVEDYTKVNHVFGSGFGLFLSGHWNRHHVAEVNKIIRNPQFTNLEGLIAALDEIKLVNQIGSLARRIRFLKHLNEMNIKDNALASETSPAVLK